MRHFLSLLDFNKQELYQLINRAIELKAMYKNAQAITPMNKKVLGMIFEKSSTRTRVSFETAAIQFGGGSIFLSPSETQLGRGEPIEDSARVLSSMVDIIMIRTAAHERLMQFAQYSKVPVINALTDFNHPCQLLADIMTFIEIKGDIKGKNICYIGDGNNMCNSWMNAAYQFEFNLNIACPKGYEPDSNLLKKYADFVQLTDLPHKAIKDADCVATDVWASMGQEDEQKQRKQDFKGFMVSEQLMKLTHDDAIFMHCLPAHRGEEVAAVVIDGKQSVVWQEAENRLHAQKSLIEFLLTNN